jgi:hypothetical protein
MSFWCKVCKSSSKLLLDRCFNENLRLIFFEKRFSRLLKLALFILSMGDIRETKLCPFIPEAIIQRRRSYSVLLVCLLQCKLTITAPGSATPGHLLHLSAPFYLLIKVGWSLGVLYFVRLFKTKELILIVFFRMYFDWFTSCFFILNDIVINEIYGSFTVCGKTSGHNLPCWGLNIVFLKSSWFHYRYVYVFNRVI